jgi:hypothetical protein
MSGVRLRYNFDFIRSLNTAEGTQRVIKQKAQDVDAALRSVNLQTRVDFQEGPNRARAAVIAGYEDNATAERTRFFLLKAIDAATDADG